MNRKVAAIGGLVMLVLLSGCAGLGGGSAATVADGEDGPDRTIEVTADGEATGEPDRASVSVAVEATGDDPQTVRDELAAGDEELRNALYDWGLDEDDVRTERYDVRESRESRDDESVEAYVGTHQYEVSVDDVNAVGEVIDVAVDAGADRVQRIQFGLSDERSADLREEALGDAMENADREADTLANYSDLTVTGVHTVSTADVHTSPYTTSLAESADAAGAAGTSVESGDVSVEVSVRVVFEAEQA